jgi:hypothetical protein
MEKEFIKVLEQSKVKTEKAIPKRKQKPKLSIAGKKKKQKLWPEDVVNKSHSISDLIDAKLSQWHDDDYDQGKDW